MDFALNNLQRLICQKKKTKKKTTNTLFYITINCLPTIILYKILLSDTNNLHTVIWFHIFRSNTNNFHNLKYLFLKVMQEIKMIMHDWVGKVIQRRSKFDQLTHPNGPLNHCQKTRLSVSFLKLVFRFDYMV